MTWPTVAVDTTDTDSGTDNPASARADLLDGLQKLNQIIAHVSAFAATIFDDADAAAVRATIGAAAAFPAGTAIVFAQTTAPTGWTKSTTHNDKALRVVSGTVGSGGATAFSSVFGSSKTTGAHTLSASEIPSISTMRVTLRANNTPGGNVNFWAGDNSGGDTGAAVDANTGGGGGHTHTLSLDLQYADVIIATKD